MVRVSRTRDRNDLYFNDDTEVSIWEKPLEIIEYDAISRGWRRILNEANDVVHVHLGGNKEIIEDRFGATFYKNTRENRCANLLYCQWAKPQDIIDQEDEERLKIKLNRPNALYEEFASDLSNWNRIIERSKHRNKPYLPIAGWSIMMSIQVFFSCTKSHKKPLKPVVKNSTSSR